MTDNLMDNPLLIMNIYPVIFMETLHLCFDISYSKLESFGLLVLLEKHQGRTNTIGFVQRS